MSDWDVPPPPYEATQSSSHKPNNRRPVRSGYFFPKKYQIGRQFTEAPLVSIAQVEGHLALLHAFAKLRLQIDLLDKYSDTAILLLPDDNDRKWAWFVGFAVERFWNWCSSLRSLNSIRPIGEILPPLDVIMVWHAYMLNPRWYTEDCVRIPDLSNLPRIGEVFSRALSFEIPRILASPPSAHRIDSWSSRMHRPFDLLEDALQGESRIVRCPACRSSIETPYMNRDGTGYLQEAFQVSCGNPKCHDVPMITKAALGSRKLAEDLVSSWQYLAGTLHTSVLIEHTTRGMKVKDRVMKAVEFQKPMEDCTDEEWIVSILKNADYSLQKMHAIMLREAKAPDKPLMGRITSAYTSDLSFSVDLAGAVLRQGSFVKKMYDFQWTAPNAFNNKEDEIVLQHAIARYHAFLDLMASSLSPVSFFVPTLDIDLAWHTHQLMGEVYNSHCKTYVRRYVDHDDKVEETTLASGFDLTCRDWTIRFDMPYVHCGCPLPGETIRQKLLNLINSYEPRATHLIPPRERSDLLAATHPSDHNAVYALHDKHHSEVSQARRREKFKERQERDIGLAKRGKLDRKRVDRSYGHDPAFLVPVPYYPVTGGCATISGNVVNSNASGSGLSGCAVGAGACTTGGTACSSGGGGCGGGCSGGGGDGGGGGCGGGCGG